MLTCLFLTAGCEFLGVYETSGGRHDGSDVTIAIDGHGPTDLPLGATLVVEGASIRFTTLAEDSRCAVHLTCVWAGRVRARFVLSVDNRSAAFTMEGFVDGESRERGLVAEVLGYRIELHAVSPYPVANPNTGEPTEQGPPTAILSVEKA